MQKNGTISQRIPFVASIVLHVAFIFLVTHQALWKSTPKTNKQRTLVKIVPVPKSIRERIVNSHEGIEVDEAKKDAYLGEKTRVVSKEMVGRDLETLAQKVPKKKQVKRKDAKRLDKKLALSKFGVPLFDANRRIAANSPQWVEGEAVDMNPQNEYIKGVDEGEYTALNTKEFTYYSYFMRIRQQLDQAWRPLLQEHLLKLYKSGRSLGSELDHRTQTLVTLDNQGTVIKVQIVSESGIEDLDEAAVGAFNQAGPFPNPPTGLVDHKGAIEVRWDFILRT